MAKTAKVYSKHGGSKMRRIRTGGVTRRKNMKGGMFFPSWLTLGFMVANKLSPEATDAISKTVEKGVVDTVKLTGNLSYELGKAGLDVATKVGKKALEKAIEMAEKAAEKAAEEAIKQAFEGMSSQ